MNDLEKERTWKPVGPFNTKALNCHPTEETLEWRYR